jgi:O-antigen/teichoic acid export membrane protein
LTLLATILLTRLLGARGYGVVAYDLAWATLLCTPAVLGMDRVLTSHLARYEAIGKWRLMQGLRIRSQQAVALTSVAIGGLAAVVGWLFTPAVYRDSFPLAAALVPLMALVTIRQATLQGISRVSASWFPQLVMVPSLLILIVVAIRVIGHGLLGPSSVMAANVAAYAGALLLGGALIKRLFPASKRSERPEFQTRSWLAAALPQAVVSLTTAASPAIVTVMLGLVAGPRPVATFNIAARIADLLSLPLFAINAPLAPLAARLQATNQIARLQTATQRAVRGTTAITALLAVVVLLLRHQLLGLFGDSFAAAGSVLTIMVLAHTLDALTGPVTVLLIMTGAERVVARVTSATLLASLVLAAWAIPTWGARGAAVSRGGYLVAENVVLAFLTYRLLGVNATILARGPRPYRRPGLRHP